MTSPFKKFGTQVDGGVGLFGTPTAPSQGLFGAVTP